MKNNILGIGILLMVFLVFTGIATAQSIAYFDPQHNSANTSESKYTYLYFEVEAGENLSAAQIQIVYDRAHINITEGKKPCGPFASGPNQYCWGTHASNLEFADNGYCWTGMYDPKVSYWNDEYQMWLWESVPCIDGPATVPICKYTVETDGTPGESPFNFGFERFPEGCEICQECAFGNRCGDELDTTWENGTFTHLGELPTYTITGSTFKNDGNPENSASVMVINLNNSNKWDATTSPSDNSYELVLNTGEDVNATEILRLIAKDGVEWINVTDHTVTQSEIDAGGVSGLDLKLDEYYLDLNEFPMYEAEGPDYNEYCGPAVVKMWLDYLHNSTTQWDDTHFGDMAAKNQDALYDWGIGNNTNTSLPYFDTQGLWYTVQYLDPEPYNQYGYNFAKDSNADRDIMLKRICQWIAYPAGDMPGHPVNVPGAVPAYGDYSNWMVIRGIHTNEDAYPLPPALEVFGFWVNDPYPPSLGGIGENSYKTADEWTNTYYMPLTTDDIYNGTYVAILEPLDDVNDTELIIADPVSKFSAEAAQVVQSTNNILSMKAVRGDIDKIPISDAEIGDVVEEADKWIVQAAIDGANEQLVPYDPDFAAVFNNVVADKPLFVNSDNGDYYLVPFAQSYKGSIAKIDAMIEELDEMMGEVPASQEDGITASMCTLASLRNDLNLDRSEIMVVIIIDAEDGHFKEASWSTQPDEYLPVTEDEALDTTGISGATAQLVYLGGSPYYPDWKITDGCSEYYVSQQNDLFDADSDCDGYLISEGDCDDNNDAVYPGATEVCDGVDNNCDGDVDEGCPTDPSVIDYDSDVDEYCRNHGGCSDDVGWDDNANNVLANDNACATCDSGGYAYITLDMGETKNSGTIMVRSVISDYEMDPHWGDTIVYGSADNSSWVSLGTFTTPESGLTDNSVSFSDEQVRYVKVYLPIAECIAYWNVDSVTW